MKEEVVVRLVELAHVLVVERRHVGIRTIALAQAPPQDVGRGLKKDHEIGRRDILREQLVQPLVDEELVVVEIQVRVNLVPVEQVVADGELTEQVTLPQRGLLAMAGEGKEQLCLEAGARTVRIEVGEKRILRFVEDNRRVETGAEPIGEQRFPDAGGPLDGDVSEIQDLNSLVPREVCGSPA